MRVLATTSRVVTTATTSSTTASLPAHCQTPGGTLHRFDPAAQISAKSYRKRKAAVSCEILPRTRSVAPGCRCTGIDLRSIGYWTIGHWTKSDHMPWRHVTSTPTAQKCAQNPHEGGAGSFGPAPAQGHASIRRMNRPPRSREPGGLLSHHPIHTEVGGFVRLPGLSGPRFQARQLRATQQPGEPVKLARVPAGTARRLPLWPRFALYCDNPGHLPDVPNKLMVGTELTFTGPKETVQQRMRSTCPG